MLNIHRKSKWKIPEKFLCVKCNEILKAPTMLKCGCRICLECFRILTESGNNSCPSGDEECRTFILEPDAEVFRDKGFEKDMNTIKIECPNKGCMDIISIKDLNTHIMGCPLSAGSNVNRTITFPHDHRENILGMLERLEQIRKDFSVFPRDPLNADKVEPVDVTIHVIQKSIKEIKNANSGLILFKTALEKPDYIWSINDFVKVYCEARSNSRSSLLSPPFYTNPCGYKMRMKIYPNGEGAGKDTHLSVYFMILHGKFDSLLDWPFQKIVTLDILSNSCKKLHSKTFKSTPMSSSSQRPTSKMNLATGDPKFILIQTLINQYLINGNLFLRMKVHF